MRTQNCYFLWLLVFFPNLIWSQQVVSSAGDFFANANGSLSFTMCEVVVETMALPNGTLTQGFQQTYPSSAAIEELVEGGISFYPNPAHESFEIHAVQPSNMENLQLFDCTGRLVHEVRMSTSGFQVIDIHSLSNGIYHLSVSLKDRNHRYMGILLKD